MSTGDSSRLHDASFSSGLSVGQFAACLHLGLRPVALVQGFCATQSVSWTTRPAGSTTRTGTIQADADSMTLVTRGWGMGLDTAYRRMLDEAAQVGAHGVIGIVETVGDLDGDDVTQFHVYGTAVVADDQPKPDAIWTTSLAGPELGKLIEVGLAPVSSVICRATTIMVASTKYYAGTNIHVYWTAAAWTLIDGSGQASQLAPPIRNPERAPQAGGLHAAVQMEVRRTVRDHVRSAIAPDALYGAQLSFSDFHLEGTTHTVCTLRGNRVHRYKSAEPVPPPRPTVSLA